MLEIPVEPLPGHAQAMAVERNLSLDPAVFCLHADKLHSQLFVDFRRLAAKKALASANQAHAKRLLLIKILTQEARKRQAIVKWARKHGVSDACARYGVSRASVYRWQKRYDGRFPPYFVVVFGGRQPACILRLV